jgi:hypothetical protein
MKNAVSRKGTCELDKLIFFLKIGLFTSDVFLKFLGYCNDTTKTYISGHSLVHEPR